MNKPESPLAATDSTSEQEHLPNCLGRSSYLEQRSYLARWLVASLLLTGGIGILAAGVSPESFSWWIKRLGLEQTELGAPIAFFFIGLVLVSLVLPKTVVSLAAGALFGTVTGGVLIALISVVAAVLNYVIGRWWFRDSLVDQVETTSGSKVEWALVIKEMSADAGYGVHLLLRFASIPSMLLNYIMGAMNARVAPFMTAAVIGILPQLLWVHSGAIASIDHHQLGAARWISTAVSLVAAIVVAVIVPAKVMKRIREIR